MALGPWWQAMAVEDRTGLEALAARGESGGVGEGVRW